MTVVPALTPVTNPEDGTMVATDVLLLVHVPPEGELLSVIVELTHTAVNPEIFDGNGLTVMVYVT